MTSGPTVSGGLSSASVSWGLCVPGGWIWEAVKDGAYEMVAPRGGIVEEVP